MNLNSNHNEFYCFTHFSMPSYAPGPTCLPITISFFNFLSLRCLLGFIGHCTLHIHHRCVKVYPSRLQFKSNESTILRFTVLSSHWLGRERSACPSKCLLYVRFVQTCKSMFWSGSTLSGLKPNHRTVLYCLLDTTSTMNLNPKWWFWILNDESES
jgi:hypothetical protein